MPMNTSAAPGFTNAEQNRPAPRGLPTRVSSQRCARSLGPIQATTRASFLHEWRSRHSIDRCPSVDPRGLHTAALPRLRESSGRPLGPPVLGAVPAGETTFPGADGVQRFRPQPRNGSGEMLDQRQALTTPPLQQPHGYGDSSPPKLAPSAASLHASFRCADAPRSASNRAITAMRFSAPNCAQSLRTYTPCAADLRQHHCPGSFGLKAAGRSSALTESSFRFHRLLRTIAMSCDDASFHPT